MFNLAAHRLADQIIARPSNADAVAAHSRVHWLCHEDGDVQASHALIGAIVGEMLDRMGEIDGPQSPEDIVYQCLWKARN